jgi:hypothetical protein
MKWGLVTGLSALAAGLGWLSWLNYSAGARVTEMREEIVKAGYPIHVKDFYKKDVADKDNAYIEFAKWKDEIGVADSAVSGDAEKQPPYLSAAKLTEAEIQELAAIMAAHQVMIDDLIQAANKPQLRLPVNLDKLDTLFEDTFVQFQGFRSIARVLSANVRLKISQGQCDEALQNAVAILKWSQLVSQQPTLVSHLVATAVRGIGIYYAAEVLYAGAVDDASLKQLEAVLISFDTNEIWKAVIFSEIPYFVDVFYPTLPVATRHLWFSLAAEADYLETMKKIGEKQMVQDGMFVNVMPDKNSGYGTGWLFGSVVPSINATQEATRRVDAQTRCLLALLEWRRQGGSAVDIKELQLVGFAAKDPYDGGFLKFRVTEFGPVIYTVGNNKVDDGGEKSLVSQQEDVGIMPLELRATLEAAEE